MPLTKFRDGFSGVVESGAVFGINVQPLREVVARLELGHVLLAVDHVSRTLRDPPDPGHVMFLLAADLGEVVTASDGAGHGGRRVHCRMNSKELWS